MTDQIEAPGSVVAGRPIAQWTADWWNWANTELEGNDPLTDTTGGRATLNQSGPVFFLGGSVGQQVTDPALVTQFDVPPNTHLLLPVVNLLGYPQAADIGAGAPFATVEDFYEFGRSIATGVTDGDVFFSLDGDGASGLSAHLEEVIFPAVFSDDPVVGPSITDPQAIADAISLGHWVMIKPLTPGSHTIEYGGGIPFFDPFGVNIRANINVVPEPGVGLLLTGGCLTYIITRRRLRRRRI